MTDRPLHPRPRQLRLRRPGTLLACLLSSTAAFAALVHLRDVNDRVVHPRLRAERLPAVPPAVRPGARAPAVEAALQPQVLRMRPALAEVPPPPSEGWQPAVMGGDRAGGQPPLAQATRKTGQLFRRASEEQ